MPETKQLTLPITGMTCANCVAAVERNIKKEPGVESAMVNLSSERAAIVFDPALHKIVRTHPSLVPAAQAGVSLISNSIGTRRDDGLAWV